MVRVLLGFTKEKEVIFADVENKRGYFSVCFDSSCPQAISYDDKINQVESYIECMEKEYILELLERFDCRPSELADELINDSYDVIEDFFDTSLYSESFNIEGVEDEIYFTASSGGQFDSRNYMQDYVNKDLYDKIHTLWDKYHLQAIPDEVAEELFQEIDRQNDSIDEYKYIEKYLTENF